MLNELPPPDDRGWKRYGCKDKPVWWKDVYQQTGYSDATALRRIHLSRQAIRNLLITSSATTEYRAGVELFLLDDEERDKPTPMTIVDN